MVFGCTGMLAYLSPQLAVVSVAVFPPVAGIGMWFGRRMKKQQKGVQAALAASSAVAEEVSRRRATRGRRAFVLRVLSFARAGYAERAVAHAGGARAPLGALVCLFS